MAGCTGASAGEPGARRDALQRTGAPKTLNLALLATREPTEGLVLGMSPTGGVEHYLTFHAGLTIYDDRSALLPHIARKLPSVDDGDWRLLHEGGMEVTWRLRPDVFWHDGTPLSAEDFAFGLEVVRDPQLAVTPSRGVSLITEALTPDAYTLVLRYKQLYAFANISGPIEMPALPRQVVGSLYASGDKQAFTNSPAWTREFVGLGPYRVGNWALGSNLEALAFDRYFLGRPKIDRLFIRYFGDANAIVASLLAQETDVSPVGSGLDLSHLIGVRQAWEPTGGGATLVAPRGVRHLRVQFRDPDAPWARDVRARQALAHLIDRQTLVDTLQFGLTVPADTFLTPQQPAFRVLEERGFPKYSYDAARAEQLLVAAGWSRSPDRQFRNSSGAPFTIAVGATGQADNTREAEALAGQWSAGGINATPALIPPTATNRDELRATVPGVYVWPWTIDPNSAENLVSTRSPSAATRWRGNNSGSYQNPLYDRLYEQYITALSVADQHGLLADINKLVAEEVALIPLYYLVLPMMARAGVRGPGMVPPAQAGNAWNIHTWEMD